MLLPKEVDLVLAFRQLSDQEQADLIAAVMANAERNRSLVERALRDAGIDPSSVPKPKRITRSRA